MDDLVTIIVPFYNVEKYISECIISIQHQTYNFWELILVNDGSIDNSLAICNSFASIDNRIKIINKKHTGVSDSRNKALDLVKGKYVIFMDADDHWILETALEQLLNIAEENDLDIIRGEYNIIDEQGDIHCSPLSSRSQIQHPNRLLTSYEFLKYAIHRDFFLWLCLFKRKTIENFQFKSGQIFLEDMRFCSQILLQDLRCMYVPELRFYAYRKNSTSVSSSINPLKIRDALDMCEFFYSLSKKTEVKELKVLFQKMSIHIYHSTLETLANDEYYINCRKYINDFKLNKKEKDIRKWISEFKLRKYFLSIIYYIPPIIGIYLFRIKHKLGRFIIFSKRNIKKILSYLHLKQ